MASQDREPRPSTDQEGAPLLSQSHDDDHYDPESRAPGPDASFGERIKYRFSLIFAPLADPERLSALEKFLLALALVLLLLAAVFVGLFAGSQHRLSHPPYSNPGSPTPTHSAPYPGPTGSPGKLPGGGGDGKTCLTKDCVLAAADILNGMDQTVDPCDDFYTYTAGNWEKNHPIPSDAGLFGAGQYVAANNARIINEVLVADNDELTGADKRNLKKLQDLYGSCMDGKSQNKAGAAPLLEVVHELRERLSGNSSRSVQELAEVNFVHQTGHRGPPSPPSDAPKPVPPHLPPGRSPRPHPPTEDPAPAPPTSARQKGLTAALAWAHSRGLSAFFDWMVDGDAKKDPTLGTPQLFPGGLGMPDKAYYEDKDELKFYTEVVEEALTALAAEEKKYDKNGHKGDPDAGKKKKKGKDEGISELAKDIVEFERLMAEMTPDGVDLSDPIATFNPVNASALPYLFPALDWPTYFSALTVRPAERIIVASKNYLTSLDSLISRTRTPVIEAYFDWVAVRELGLNLGADVSLHRPADRLDRRSKGVDESAPEDRETVCLGKLNEALGFMSGRFFVEAAFSSESKARAEGIIKDIVVAFKERLPDLSWLDRKTRDAAEKKADAVRIKVGYPTSPNTTDGDAIERYYNDLTVKKDDYFGNLLAARTRDARRSWAYVGRKLDPGRWDMFTSEVNAYYNPGGNEIVFPAGILQPPYFSAGWPDYLQFGAFGAVAGHELSHAFDPDGRLYDEEGYLRDWWTKSTAKEFNKRRDCIIEQYGNYSISDGKGGRIPLNSKLTQGEDIADAGGLVQSWRAWHDRLERAAAVNVGDGNNAGVERVHVENGLLPGLGDFTQEQLFFIAYGLSWARAVRQQEAIRRIRTDPHSPTKYRVIGALANIPEFAKTFGCKPGDRMARKEKERCAIW